MTITENIKLASGAEVSADYLNHALTHFLTEPMLAEFLQACGRPLRKSIRVNPLKISLEDFRRLAREFSWTLQPVPWCDHGFWIESESANLSERSLGNYPQHIQGLFYVQEASSMLPVRALLHDYSPEQRPQPLIADFAAAPGSKTTQLAALVNNRGLIVANELSSSRIKFLAANLTRCGVMNTVLLHQDGQKLGGWLPGKFDYIMLDAPCGGEGTVRKDLTALKHWSLDQVEAMASLQKSLILSAYQALKPGGRLVYSTCTLSPQENQQVVSHLLSQTDARLQPLNNLFAGAEQLADSMGCLLLLPQTFDCEGFFVACLEKPAQSSQAANLKPLFSSPFAALNPKTEQQLVAYYRDHFQLDMPPAGFELRQRDKEIWLFSKQIEQIAPLVKLNRAGSKIAEIYPNKIKSSHEFAMLLGEQALRQKQELTPPELSDFIGGKNLNLNTNDLAEGEVILCFQGKPLGMGQNQKGKIKNGLPRELVRDGFV